MIRPVGTIAAFLSAIFFPWPLTLFFVLVVALVEPLVPLAVGIFLDTLYYTPHGIFFPSFTIVGAVVTAISFFVHSRLKTSSIGR